MDQILEFLMTLGNTAQYIIMGLGGIVVIVTAVDTAIPDDIDKGFMKKLLDKPIIGDLLRALKKFSPFNTKDKK